MKRFLVTVAIIVGAGLTVQGYVLDGYHWEITEIPYYVNPANQDISPEAALAAVRWAAEAWSMQTDADIRLVYAGLSTATQPSCNGKSEVMFRNVIHANRAIGSVRSCASGTRRLESDISFYDADYTFYSAAIGGCVKDLKGHYIEGIAIHEFGHVFGLGHTDVTGATMKAGATRCSKAKMSLEADDIAGLEFLYPPSGSPDPGPDPEPEPDPDEPAPPTGILLSIVRWGVKPDGTWGVELDWSGTSTTSVQLYLNGVKWKRVLATNDAGYLYSVNSTNPGPHTFLVCNDGTTMCSEPVTGSAQ